MTVQGDNWSHDFTLICIPLIKIWQNPDAWPEAFTGSVITQTNADKTFIQAQTEPIEDIDALTSDEQSEHASGPVQAGNEDKGLTAFSEVKTKTNKKASGKPPSSNPLTDFSIENIGQQFLDWVVAGIQDRSIDYNNPGARVHVVNEGVLLVSPGSFKDFVKLHKEIGSWDTVQKKFLKLNLHERTEGGLNVHQYRVSGSNHNATIMALLLKDVGVLFKSGKPSANPHVYNDQPNS
jgi:hypothetical protein